MIALAGPAVTALIALGLSLAVGTGDDGELVGLITPENLGEMLMVHEALARAPRPAPPADAPPRPPRVEPAGR